MTLNQTNLNEIDKLNNLVDSLNTASFLLSDMRWMLIKLTNDEIFSNAVPGRTPVPGRQPTLKPEVPIPQPAVQSQVFASPSDEGYDYAEEENLPQVFGASPEYYSEDWASPEDEYAEEQDYQTEVFGASHQYYPEVWAPPDDYQTEVFGAPPQYYPEVWAPPDDEDAEERENLIKEMAVALEEAKTLMVEAYKTGELSVMNDAEERVLKNCINCIFENKISDAMKTFPAVLKALKSPSAAVVLFIELGHRALTFKGKLEPQKADLVMRLTNRALETLQAEVQIPQPAVQSQVFASPFDEGYDYAEEENLPQVFGASPRYYPEDENAEEQDYQTEVFGASPQYYPEVWAPPDDYQTEVFGAPPQYYPEVWAPPGGEDYIEGDFGAEFSEQQYQAAPDEEWVEGVDVPTLTCRRRRRRGCHSDSSLPSNDNRMCQLYKAYYEATAPCVTSTPKKERMCKFYQAFYETFAPCVTSTPKSPYSPVSPIPLASRVANLNRRVEQLEGELGQQYGGGAPPSQPRVTNFMARNRPMRL